MDGDGTGVPQSDGAKSKLLSLYQDVLEHSTNGSSQLYLMMHVDGGLRRWMPEDTTGGRRQWTAMEQMYHKVMARNSNYFHFQLFPSGLGRWP